MKTIIIGATGMVGAALLEQLLENPNIEKLTSLVRRKTGITHPKLTEIVVNFAAPETWEQHVVGDVLYSCMGTTLADAGSKKKQFAVDYDYQYFAAKAARKNNVRKYALISSTGANEQSKNFYLWMKGKLDNDVMALGFEQCFIFRPGQLWGNRKRKRWAETVALKIMFSLNKMGVLHKYKPIHATQLAKAILNATLDATNKHKNNIYNLSEIFNLI